jgi:hypothetical protein
MYASVSDVRNLAPYVAITRDSTPSEGVVNAWISDVENSLNMFLESIGYVVPVVGPRSVAAIKQMVAHAVIAMVLRARPNPEQDPVGFQDRFNAWMKALRDPNDPTSLIDAEKNASGDATVKGSAVRVSSNLRDLLDEEPMRVNRNQVF